MSENNTRQAMTPEKEFAAIRESFLQSKYDLMMERLTELVTIRELKDTTLLLTKRQARAMAQDEFLQGCAKGTIDCFNEITTNEDYVFI